MLQPTVLIVDDEPLIRWSIGERLRAEGFDVLEAGDGASALAQFNTDVDVVLLDSKLPGLGGLSVLTRLLKIDPDVAAVLMTADSGGAIADLEGRFPIAYKPFLLEELVGLVRRALTVRNNSRRGENLRSLALRPAMEPS